jgi:hypothetical protein
MKAYRGHSGKHAFYTSAVDHMMSSTFRPHYIHGNLAGTHSMELRAWLDIMKKREITVK